VQLNWSTIQTEAYAIFVCCTQRAYLIRDRPFSIHTDHKNLTFMTKNSSSMVTRWYVALQEFDYTLHFVKGSRIRSLTRCRDSVPTLPNWLCLYRYQPPPKMVCHSRLFAPYHLRRMINSRHFRCVTTPS
jgi:RNase H-like domain found in reverse transcriptase